MTKKLITNLSILLFSTLLISCSTSSSTVGTNATPVESAVPTSDLPSQPKLKTQSIEYKDGDATLEGYLAYDENITGKRPAVLVVHEWKGINDYIKNRTDELAKMGYVAFAPDIYGKGIRPTTNQEAGAQAGKYKSDRALMRSRVNAGFTVLRNNELADLNKTAAIGYCFGGTTVLELARSGTALNGFVSFHGGLDSPKPEDGKNIKGKVLILHGADDPTISPEDMTNFQNEMKTNAVDWQMVYYGGAVHAFSNPDSGNNKASGSAYNENAAKKSWEDMKEFFSEIFK